MRGIAVRTALSPVDVHRSEGERVMRSRGRTPRVTVLGAAAVLGVVAVAFAAAAIPDENGTIHACRMLKSGKLRVVADPDSCRPKERKISWNIRGPKGDAGPAGVAGSQGPPGERGATGEPGPQGLQAQPARRARKAIREPGFRPSRLWEVLLARSRVTKARSRSSTTPTAWPRSPASPRRRRRWARHVSRSTSSRRA